MVYSFSWACIKHISSDWYKNLLLLNFGLRIFYIIYFNFWELTSPGFFGPTIMGFITTASQWFNIISDYFFMPQMRNISVFGMP